jgi:hypothetical protein
LWSRPSTSTKRRAKAFRHRLMDKASDLILFFVGACRYTYCKACQHECEIELSF